MFISDCAALATNPDRHAGQYFHLLYSLEEEMMVSFRITTLMALVGAANAASSLGEVKHVVMMMLENRSFQHVSVLNWPKNHSDWSLVTERCDIFSTSERWL